MTEKLCDEALQARMQDLKENLSVIRENMAAAAEKSGRTMADVQLLAATKTVPVELINYGIALGIDRIGENKVQELLDKFDAYAPCEKHFIGVLQTNKVKYLPGRVSLIESCDSVHLAKEIARQAVKHGVVMPVLLEVNVGGEESKGGFAPDALFEACDEIAAMEGLCVRGLMAIPPICDSDLQLAKYFDKMQQYYVDIKAKKMDNGNMNILSMGMSADYALAIAHGATQVRIGSLLFGKRIYAKR